MISSHAHVVITGGAGFVGSHLCQELLDRGAAVTAIDNLSTGHEANLAEIRAHPRFVFRADDITDKRAFDDLHDVTHLVHLACPASPKANTAMPLETIRAATIGTLNALDLTADTGARAVVASSSEIYGDPQVHPQVEHYRGNADPVGVFSAYTEGKRVTEAAAAAHARLGTNVGIVRPFNVYGPKMWPDDGRVVSAFCAAALSGQTLILDNGGTQTRSLVWIGDFVDGLIALLDTDHRGPVNLGSEDEVTIRDLAELVVRLAGTGSVEIGPGRSDVVTVRRPDITLARTLLGWSPTTSLEVGVQRCLDWMCEALDGNKNTAA
ncbi:NAD-dependent epimerase/dehydratase family protein [Nocardia sp. NPDC058379]|uniref:NAD-dependent epimerase/dehydratase family protein n=1 Tax=unclassified Nocardia TaxID=2637762 RepID=UPI003654953E